LLFFDTEARVEKALTAWLPLLVAVLVFLRVMASLLGKNPRSDLGESPLFEKVTKTRRSMVGFVVAVALFMSAVLGLLALAFTLLRYVDFQQWMIYLAYAIIAVGGVAFLAFQVFYLVRLFSSTFARWVVGVAVVLIAAAWVVWPSWLTVDLAAIVLIAGGLSLYLQSTLNFKIVLLAGSGLFIYDIVNVYFTGNMMRVAKPMIEAGFPGLVVVPANWSLDALPAAALGAGDIIFPGLMIMLGAVVSYRHGNKSPMYGGLIGYAIGLIIIFGVLYFAKTGQPALITLYPCVLAGVLLGARRAGLTRELFAMRHPKPDTEQRTPEHSGDRD
jgi:presenilin-like A22 family membrane protease